MLLCRMIRKISAGRNENIFHFILGNICKERMRGKKAFVWDIFYMQVLPDSSKEEEEEKDPNSKE